MPVVLKMSVGEISVRKAVFGALCLFAASNFASAAFAASSELAPSEIVMTIYAKGVVHSPPDKITISHEFSEAGADEASARAALNAHLESVRKKLSSLNMVSYSVALGETKISKQASLAEMMQAAASKPAEPNAPADHPAHAKASLSVVFHDVTKLAAVKVAQEADDSPTSWILNGTNPFQSPFALMDDAKARSEAVADAIAKARAEAQLYTRHMGYHIVRIKGFGNDTQMYNIGDVSGMMSKVMPFFGPGTMDVTTDANIKVEYVVAPD